MTEQKSCTYKYWVKKVTTAIPKMTEQKQEI